MLLRKFVNISVDLMTRGPPFGITQAYEAGEEGTTAAGATIIIQDPTNIQNINQVIVMP